MGYHYFILVLILNVHLGFSDANSGIVTQTVYGFLDFTTTIGNTVMVFSPQSAPTLDIKGKFDLPLQIIKTKPITKSQQGSENGINPTLSVKSSTAKSKEESVNIQSARSSTSSYNSNIFVSKIVQKSSNDIPITKETVLQIVNNLYQPEYDLLSRQPSAYAEETYRVVNLKTRNNEKNRGSNIARSTHGGVTSDSRPVGLVTRLSGSELKDGVTTIHETSIIGTYISGKYAQILQSSSNVYKNRKPKIRSTTSSSLRVLKTATQSMVKSNPTIKLPVGQSALSNRLRNKISNRPTHESVTITESSESGHHEQSKKNQSRRKSKRKNKNSAVSSTIKSISLQTVEPSGRKSFRPKIQPSSTEADNLSSPYMFKLNRTPGRWQYKSSPKPRVTIRKQTTDSTTSALSDISSTSTAISLQDQIVNDNPVQNSILDQGDLESSGSQNGPILNNVYPDNKKKPLVETLNIEISTPVNFKDTYYEIATIKTPFTFQAGVVKKTRYITVTSTFEKVLRPEPTSLATVEGPLTENILALTAQRDRNLLESSIVTLTAIYLTGDNQTPNLETTTESFSIFQTKLRTQVLPIVRDNENETSYITFVQTYDFTSLITATRTFSPLQSSQFIPLQNFKDFGGNLEEAGSEINLELEFGDESNSEDFTDDKPYVESRNGDLSISDNNKSSLASPTVIQNLNSEQQSALFNLYNPIPTIITTSHPVVKLETLWESHVVPIINGISTSYRTLSKVIGVVDKTEFMVDTSTLSLPPIPPPVSVNPYLLPVQQQHFQTITSSIVQQTIATQTNSKVLKLTFGAKTAYTTIFSTAVVPTSLTVFFTTSFPVQPTAAFPGYYPPPYPPYAYVG